MKNKIFSLILGILAAGNVIYSFFGNDTTGKIFTFEMNIWIYRLIWLGAAVGFLLEYLKILKQEKS